MKKTLLFIILLFVTYSYGQTEVGTNFKLLFDQEKYDEIINYQPKDKRQLTASDLFYKGKAFYMMSADEQANQYFDQAIEKGPVFGSMYFHKAMIMLYANKFNESLPLFDKAISLSPTESDFYAGKAEALSALKKTDSAQVYFEKATQLPSCKPRAFVMLGQIYQGQNKSEQASATYQHALNQLSEDDEMYQNTSFNLGVTQQLTGKIHDARKTFEKHIALYPTDFHALAKMIQVYYALEQFEKAAPLKKKLYAAHEAKRLSADMEKQFCFDQFVWNGKRVMAFEKFAEPDDFLFAKHHFYVMTDNNEIDYQIDSESSAAIRLTDSKNKYVLCLVKNQTHHTYWQYVFSDYYQYPDLKVAVLNILNEKVKPSASFIPGKK